MAEVLNWMLIIVFVWLIVAWLIDAILADRLMAVEDGETVNQV